MEAGKFVSQIEEFTEEDFVAKTVTPLADLKKLATKDIRYRMELYNSYLQAQVMRQLCVYEPVKIFQIDPWMRVRKEGKGGGITCVLQDGDVFEKAGVGTSAIWGPLRVSHAEVLRRQGKDIPQGDGSMYYATGISCILHPKNPFVPSFHFNIRYFQVTNGEKCVCWFGGGCNMTPNYVNTEDFRHFHRTLKAACDKHDPSFYPLFKQEEDCSTFIEHRGEHRGIGGIRFELFDKPFDECFSFIVTCGEALLRSYLPIVDLRKDDEYEERHTLWQQVRRGRYIEYNLLYDKGTRFGLTTPDVRIESVLMALPLHAGWDSLYEVKTGSEEEKMVEVLQHPRWWIE